MLKLITQTAFYEPDEPQITILSLGDKASNHLEKTAAHEDIKQYVSKLDIKPGYTYLHINAMTAGEWYSSNRNGDFFPEENLKAHYKTFETTPAYVYRSHVNKQPSKSYGKVIFSVYNERMHRVELIAECPDDLVEDVNSRIQKGDFPTTSMACKTPADTCSICGNRAHSRQEYCSHLRTELNRLYPDGRKVYAINDQPLTFFDISIVIRPADVNSSILQKVAFTDVVGSAELAEVEGLTEDGFHKRAAFKKLSELVKEISDGCYVVGASTDPAALGVGAAKDLPVHLIDKIHHFELGQILGSMADLGISPSVKFLVELIARKHLGEGYSGIGELAENLLHEVPADESIPVAEFEEPSERSLMVDSILKPFIESSSLFPSAIEKRASNIGYAGNGPHIELTPEELKIKKEISEVLDKTDGVPNSYTKLLLSLGGAALLAKWFITSQIEKKLRQQNTSRENGVKISIVKQSSDYLVTSQLAKLAMAHSLPSNRHDGKNSDKDSKSSNAVLMVTKRILKNTKTSIGGKLLGLLRVFSLGSRMT